MPRKVGVARALAVAAAVAACAASGADAAESRKVSARPQKGELGGGGWAGRGDDEEPEIDLRSRGRAFLQLLQLDFSQIDWGQVFTDEFSLDSLSSFSSNLVDGLAGAISGDLFTGIFGSL